MGEFRTRTTGTVIPFPPTSPRRLRAAPESERRGELLLFMGVRYERMPDPAPLPAAGAWAAGAAARTTRPALDAAWF